MNPIIPLIHKDPFDDPAYLFELKYDGFRGLADTINSRILSKNRNRMKRFERLLETLPKGCVFDGEIVALDWSKSALMTFATFAVVTGYSNPNPPLGGHHAMVLSSRDYSASRRHHYLCCAELPDRHCILYAHE